MAEQNSIDNKLPAIWQQTPSGTTENVIMNSSGELGSASSSGGGSITVTEFSSSGSWQPDSSTKHVVFYIWSSGAGGGSGRRGTSTNASGGAGGSGGALSYFQVSTATVANRFSSVGTYTVTIGAGGTGGASVTTNDTDGNDGGGMSTSAVGDVNNTLFIISSTLGAGQGGTSTGAGEFSFDDPQNAFTASTTNISPQGIGNFGGEGSLTTGDDAVGGTVYFLGGGSGGGAGGAGFETGVDYDGGDGQPIYDMNGNVVLAGGTGGNSGSPNGGAGTAYNGSGSGSFIMSGGSGGGGGARSSTNGPGNGGNGGDMGGAGGGGAGSENGTNSGAGGDGADGRVIIVEFP